MQNLQRAVPRGRAERGGSSQSPLGLMAALSPGHGRYNSGTGGSKSTEPRFIVRCVAASLSYEVLTVWMPHSVLGLPRQRPARASSSGDVRLVPGMHPTDRKPDPTRGCGGSVAAAYIAPIGA